MSLELVEGFSEAEFSSACAEVAASVGASGVVFVQPRVEASEAGIAFYDGHHYEITSAAGSNVALTSGTERGAVVRGGRGPGEPDLVPWLEAIRRCFRAAGVLDIEWARDATGFVLLQVRPAPFEVRRNRRLSLANHKEILGELPSPWMVSTLERAGAEALEFFGRVDPEVGRWNEPYAICRVGRPFLNVSFFERLMDRWGLPRALVYEGIGGGSEDPASDRRVHWGRLLSSAPRLVGLQLRNLVTVLGTESAFARYDERQLEPARGLLGLFEAGVQGLALALNTNFAINGALSGVTKVRSFLRLGNQARVLTADMMEEWDDLRSRPAPARAAALDRWLERWGHRGPLESDLSRPRFEELRTVLLEDLSTDSGTGPRSSSRRGGGRGPLYALDRRRERFRDELMKRWRTLRARILEEAELAVQEGRLEQAADVFFLQHSDLLAADEGRGDLREAVCLRREAFAAHREVRLGGDDAITEDELQAGLHRRAARGVSGEPRDEFPGIALTRMPFRGRVVRADDLLELLERVRQDEVTLNRGNVLVVPTLEPSWAVVFGRVGGVVAELGGELSHASILLREAGKPAIVNCAGVFHALRDGDEVELDSQRDRVRRVTGVRPSVAARG